MKDQNTSSNAPVFLLIVFTSIVASLIIGALIIAPAMSIKPSEGAIIGVVPLFAAAFITGLGFSTGDPQALSPTTQEPEQLTRPEATSTASEDEHPDNNKSVN